MDTGILLGMITALAWGTADALAPFASRRLGSLTACVVAQGSGLIVLALLSVMPWGQIWWRQITINTIAFDLVIGGLLGLISSLAYATLYRSMQLGPLTLVSPLLSTNGVVTLLLAMAFLKESIDSLHWVLFLSILISILVIVTPKKDRSGSFLLPGLLYALVSLSCFGLFYFAVGALSKDIDSWYRIVLCTRGFSFVFLVCFLCLFHRDLARVGRKGEASFRMSVADLSAVSMGVCDVVGMLVFSVASRQSGTAVIAMVASCYVLLPFLIGIVGYKERLQFSQGVGVFLLLTSLFVLSCPIFSFFPLVIVVLLLIYFSLFRKGYKMSTTVMTEIGHSPKYVGHQKYSLSFWFSFGLNIVLISAFALVFLIPRFSSLGATLTFGQISFQSSDQTNPANSQGLNDIITITAHHFSTPASGKSYVAWLMPDDTFEKEETQPLYLGSLAIVNGDASLTYTDLAHTDLLLSYSGVEITEESQGQMPLLPSLDPSSWQYLCTLPALPTPGDAKHFSYLDHLRHLLAQDPTLHALGLSGGLAIWLEHNSLNLVQWAGDARDNWQGGQQTALIHRHMLRILDLLDGTTYVAGDVPLGSPILVDPLAGRVGLLQLQAAQPLPSYLTHIALHVQGLIQAPGHTQASQRLALKIDTAINQEAAQLQQVRQDALQLVKMDATHLQRKSALALIDDLTTNATQAYLGRYDRTSGENFGGAAWIRSALQTLAIMPIQQVHAQ